MWHAPQLHWRRLGLELLSGLIEQQGRAHGRPRQVLLSDTQSESVLLRDVRCVPEGRRRQPRPFRLPKGVESIEVGLAEDAAQTLEHVLCSSALLARKAAALRGLEPCGSCAHVVVREEADAERRIETLLRHACIFVRPLGPLPSPVLRLAERTLHLAEVINHWRPLARLADDIQQNGREVRRMSKCLGAQRETTRLRTALL